jgi:hypothetical protein
MLWKEHAVRVISPPRAGPSNIIGPEALRKVSSGYCAADILDEPAHEVKCGIDGTGRSPSPFTDHSGQKSELAWCGSVRRPSAWLSSRREPVLEALYVQCAAYTFRPLGWALRRVTVGCALAAGAVLPWWLSVVSAMITGCDRCAAGGAARGSA